MNAADCKVEKYEVITYVDARNLLRNFKLQWSSTHIMRKTLISSTISSVVFMNGMKTVAAYKLDEMVLEIYKPARPTPTLVKMMEEI